MGFGLPRRKPLDRKPFGKIEGPLLSAGPLLNGWKLANVGRCLGAGGVAPGMAGSALAGSLGESLSPFSPGLSGSAGLAAFHPTAAWKTFPGESGVAVGRNCRCQCRDALHRTLAWPPRASTGRSLRPTSSQTQDLGARPAGKGFFLAQMSRWSTREKPVLARCRGREAEAAKWLK